MNEAVGRHLQCGKHSVCGEPVAAGTEKHKIPFEKKPISYYVGSPAMVT
jgi:hypothetical protein